MNLLLVMGKHSKQKRVGISRQRHGCGGGGLWAEFSGRAYGPEVRVCVTPLEFLWIFSVSILVYLCVCIGIYVYMVHIRGNPCRH